MELIEQIKNISQIKTSSPFFEISSKQLDTINEIFGKKENIFNIHNIDLINFWKIVKD